LLTHKAIEYQHRAQKYRKKAENTATTPLASGLPHNGGDNRILVFNPVSELLHQLSDTLLGSLPACDVLCNADEVLFVLHINAEAGKLAKLL
jgi:hypothetical protein